MFAGFDGWLRIDENTANGPRPYSVSELIQHLNFVLEREFAEIEVEGEVASFKVSQHKWVFFDLKDESQSLSCFLPLDQLRLAVREGMKVRLRATPRVTRAGRFSLTVSKLLPLGEGSIQKNFKLLRQRLAQEGLFAPEKKRALPENPHLIGVISSVNAAGYHDFLKILDNRWGGMKICVINTQVQGLDAPEQISRALDAFNEQGEVEVIVILRGGGSADDLAAFNDEGLVRAIARSRVPVLTGIGHEVDESLADLAADVRASTPSNAAERLVQDRHVVQRQVHNLLQQTKQYFRMRLVSEEEKVGRKLEEIRGQLATQLERTEQHVHSLQQTLMAVNPEAVLQRGYAIIRERQPIFQIGDTLNLFTTKQLITAEVKHVQERNKENYG